VVTYTDQGQSPGGPHAGDAIVMVHGLPGSVRDYRWLEAAIREGSLGQRVRVVRLDMPGLGGTSLELAQGRHDVESRALFVLSTLEALGLERVILVGHSMGGGVVLKAAAIAQERQAMRARGHAGVRVAGIALLASVGQRPHRAYRKLPDPRPAGLLLKVPLLERLLHKPIYESFVRGGFPKSVPVHECVQALRCVSALRFDALEHAVRQLDLRPLPSLVAYADDDPMVEPEIGEGLTQALGAEELRFPEGGHNIQKTHAIEIAQGLARLTQSAFGQLQEARNHA
jgi:pimeloyl-ACP methyl ester carboxylesterase